MAKKLSNKEPNRTPDPKAEKQAERKLLVVDLINATTPPRNEDGSPVEGALSAFQTLMAERTGRWSFTLSKAASLVEGEIKAYQAGHTGLLQKFGTVQEIEGKPTGQYTIPAENRQEFAEEFNRLLLTEVAWSLPKVPVSVFGDDSALTGSDAMLLWWLVE